MNKSKKQFITKIVSPFNRLHSAIRARLLLLRFGALLLILFCAVKNVTTIFTYFAVNVDTTYTFYVKAHLFLRRFGALLFVLCSDVNTVLTIFTYLTVNLEA